jgi:hypothetical protein
MGASQKLLFNILFTKDIKTQVLIHFGYITKSNFLIELKKLKWNNK